MVKWKMEKVKRGDYVQITTKVDKIWGDDADFGYKQGDILKITNVRVDGYDMGAIKLEDFFVKYPTPGDSECVWQPEFQKDAKLKKISRARANAIKLLKTI